MQWATLASAEARGILADIANIMAESAQKTTHSFVHILYSRLFTRSHVYNSVHVPASFSEPFRYLFVSHKDPAVYDVLAIKPGIRIWSKTPATSVSLLRRLGLDPDIHHVFVMGTGRPASGAVGSVVTSDDLDLWDYVSADAKSLFVRVEALPLDAADLAAIRDDGTFEVCSCASS